MKLAVQLTRIPGRDTTDKTKWAKDHGAEGIELIAASNDTLHAHAEAMRGMLPVSSVCGNADDRGADSFDFLNVDRNKRRASLDHSRRILGFCGQVGAVGQIVPPHLFGQRMPDFSPAISPDDLAQRLMVAMVKELGDHAAECKTRLLLEPLNRYEQPYLNRLEQGVGVIEQAGTRGAALLADLFHMHIEETSTPEAFRAAGKHVAHLHLADNTRKQPGTGDIDFAAAFAALKAIGFKGYMAYECGITGDNDDQRRTNLAKSLAFLRECM